MIFDYSKLRGKIKECFDTQKSFAQALGISERALSLKLNNKVFFSQDEIEKICSLLNILDIGSYFFVQKVQNNELSMERRS